MYEKVLEAVSSGPQLSFDAVQLLAAPTSEVELAFDLLERLSRELSLRFRVLGMLESLPQEVERVLGLEHLARTSVPPAVAIEAIVDQSAISSAAYSPTSPLYTPGPALVHLS